MLYAKFSVLFMRVLFMFKIFSDLTINFSLGKNLNLKILEIITEI